MNNISRIIKISSHGFYIKFSCNAANIYSRDVIFGETEETESDSSEEEPEEKKTL